MKTFTQPLKGFSLLMHEKITAKGNSETYCIKNNYPKYNRTRF